MTRPLSVKIKDCLSLTHFVSLLKPRLMKQWRNRTGCSSLELLTFDCKDAEGKEEGEDISGGGLTICFSISLSFMIA